MDANLLPRVLNPVLDGFGGRGAQVLTLGAARLWLVRFPAGMTLRAAPADHFRRDAFVSFQLQGSRTLMRDGRVFRIEAGQMSLGRAPRDGSETTYPLGAQERSMALARRSSCCRCPSSAYARATRTSRASSAFCPASTSG